MQLHNWSQNSCTAQPMRMAQPTRAAPGDIICGTRCRLVTNACTKLFKIDVTDIGTWVAPGNEEFFRKCGFSVDKFNSVAMSLDRGSASGQLLVSGAEESVGLDLQLMQETCKMQRIEQALLRYVIPA